MFVGKVRSLPYSAAAKRYFTQVGSGLIRKHMIRLEKACQEQAL